jgi:hypothetical protein
MASPTRLIADDCTPERLATLLRDHDGRIAVMSPEGDVFDLLAGRYSANKKGNFGVYLKGHAGDTLYVDRVGRPMEFVKAPAITVGLAVQPDVIRGLAQNPGFRGRGLLGRFLYSLPVSLLGHRDPNAPPVPEDVRTTYQAQILALLKFPFAKDEMGDSHPCVLTLTPEARDSLQAFESWIEPQLAEFGDLGGIADWAGKLMGAVGRIAANLHMASFAGTATPWDMSISLGTVERAILIGKYLIPHAKAAFAEMGVDPVVQYAKVILRWLEHTKSDCFTKRDLHQAMKGTFKRVADLDQPLTVLVAQGFIRERPEESRGPGRPPSPTYDVNPMWRRFGSSDSCPKANSEDCEDSETPLRLVSIPGKLLNSWT